MENENENPNLDTNKVIEYSNVILPKLNELINDGAFGETVSTNELLLALAAVLPQSIYESTRSDDEDGGKITLLQMNHMINELLFELK